MSKLETITLLPEVAAFLGPQPLPGVIGGEKVPASNGETFVTVDPGSGEPLATVYALQPDDVDRAVKSAQRASEQQAWAKLPPNERGVLLHRLADEVERRLPIFAQLESLDAGKLLAQAESDAANFVATLRYYTDLAQHVLPRSPLAVAGHDAYTARFPWGACGFIFPWNFPLALDGWGIAPALAAGNTAVVKPAEDTPLSSLYLAETALAVGLPPGVLNVVPGLGEVAGAALSAHPGIKRMSFTGSPEVGKLVAEACGRNLVPVKLELGGKGAAVVFDDVDLDDTADKLVGAITFHCGQVCCDCTRWLIQESIYDRFVSAVCDRMSSVTIGHELDAAAAMGPVVNAKQRARVLGYLERGVSQGAELVLPGGAAEVSGCPNGYYVKPALLAGGLDNVAAQEEIFGPVAFLSSFKDEADAVAKANQTRYGLANSVWSSDLPRCYRVAESMVAGNSWINAHNVFAHGVPYGGVNLSGMGGGVLSPEALADYLRSLSVVRPL